MPWQEEEAHFVLRSWLRLNAMVILLRALVWDCLHTVLRTHARLRLQRSVLSSSRSPLLLRLLPLRVYRVHQEVFFLFFSFFPLLKQNEEQNLCCSQRRSSSSRRSLLFFYPKRRESLHSQTAQNSWKRSLTFLSLKQGNRHIPFIKKKFRESKTGRSRTISSSRSRGSLLLLLSETKKALQQPIISSLSSGRRLLFSSSLKRRDLLHSLF